MWILDTSFSKPDSDIWFDEGKIAEQGINPADTHFTKVWQLTGHYIGFTRQLRQHTGGFVITQEKLHYLCPTFNTRMQNRTCIKWNKDDIKAPRFMKIDVLALDMLTYLKLLSLTS